MMRKMPNIMAHATNFHFISGKYKFNLIKNILPLSMSDFVYVKLTTAYDLVSRGVSEICKIYICDKGYSPIFISFQRTDV
jgi:hypothetical protein